MGSGTGIPIIFDDEITIKKIRDIINIPEPGELSNDTIDIAIQRASIKIYRIAELHGVTGDLVTVAILNYSAYLAYLSYADRVFNVLPGQYDRQGEWNPIGEEILRRVEDKLDHLKKLAEESIEDLEEDLPEATSDLYGGLIPTISKTKDSLYYPWAYRTSDLAYPDWEEE